MRTFRNICAVLVLMFAAAGAGADDQSLCAAGSTEVQYPNGSLKSCVLKNPLRTNGIICKSQSPVSFYDNGQLDTCVLAEPAKVSGQECKEFGLVSFYPDGKFRSCVKKN